MTITWKAQECDDAIGNDILWYAETATGEKGRLGEFEDMCWGISLFAGWYFLMGEDIFFVIWSLYAAVLITEANCVNALVLVTEYV